MYAHTHTHTHSLTHSLLQFIGKTKRPEAGLQNAGSGHLWVMRLGWVLFFLLFCPVFYNKSVSFSRIITLISFTSQLSVFSRKSSHDSPFFILHYRNEITCIICKRDSVGGKGVKVSLSPKKDSGVQSAAKWPVGWEQRWRPGVQGRAPADLTHLFALGNFWMALPSTLRSSCQKWLHHYLPLLQMGRACLRDPLRPGCMPQLS